MSIRDSGELGLSRKPLALVGPIPEGSFNDVESRIGNRRLPNRVIRSGGGGGKVILKQAFHPPSAATDPVPSPDARDKKFNSRLVVPTDS